MRLRLSVLMFLEFFVWGGWFVTLGSYLAQSLSASGVQLGAAYSTQSWGAIIAPFIVGLIADRYFNAERVLAVLHLAGGVSAARTGPRDHVHCVSAGPVCLYGPVYADSGTGQLHLVPPAEGSRA